MDHFPIICHCTQSSLAFQVCNNGVLAYGNKIHHHRTMVYVHHEFLLNFEAQSIIFDIMYCESRFALPSDLRDIVHCVLLHLWISLVVYSILLYIMFGSILLWPV